MTTLKIKYQKNLHQEEFHEDDINRILYLSCGYGGGKTYSLIMKMIKLSWLNRNIDGGLVAPSFPELKRDVLPTLEQIATDSEFEYKHHKSDNWIRFPWTTGKIWLASAERKIRGPNWGFAGINEVTLLKESSYNEVLGRVRIKKAKCSQIVMSGTPEGTEHWLYKNLIENKNPYANVIYGDTRNNAHNLDPIYLKSLEESFDAVMLDAYLRGLWVNMKGNRFYYSYDPDKNHQPIKYNPDYPVLIAMDFNVNPMTCTLWHKHDDSLYGFDEITLMSADTKKLCDAIKARGYKPENCTIYPDPTGKNNKTNGKSDIKILKEEGFTNVLHKPKAPSMRTRQLNVNNLLDKEQIIINKNTMPKLHQDLQSVSQCQITLGKDKKNMDLTHWSDGLDYLCDIEFPFSGKKPRIKQFQHNF